MVMPWLLDTNHWIYLLKGRCLPLQEKLAASLLMRSGCALW